MHSKLERENNSNLRTVSYHHSLLLSLFSHEPLNKCQVLFLPGFGLGQLRVVWVVIVVDSEGEDVSRGLQVVVTCAHRTRHVSHVSANNTVTTETL